MNNFHPLISSDIVCIYALIKSISADEEKGGATLSQI